MIRKLLQQWNWVRLLRLVIGIAAVVQGFIQNEWVLLLAGAFVMGSAVLNTGCCGASVCPTPSNKKDVHATNPSIQKEIEYEEVVAGK